MGKYGEAAVKAVRLYRRGPAESPQDAWQKATVELFGQGTSGQIKGCPKGAFLGLCEEGLIEGIEPGIYTRSQKNKKYAIRAVAILKQCPSLSSNPDRLWSDVLDGEPKTHNSQMDVVVSLWNNKLVHVKRKRRHP